MKKQGADIYNTIGDNITVTDNRLYWLFFWKFPGYSSRQITSLILQSNVHGQNERTLFLIETVMISQASNLEFFSGIL